MKLRKGFTIFFFFVLVVLSVWVFWIFGVMSTSFGVRGQARVIKDVGDMGFVGLDKLRNISLKEEGVAFSGDYFVYQNEVLIGNYDNFEEAKAYGEKYANSAVKKRGEREILWNNFAKFIVYRSQDDFMEFDNYKEAIDYCKARGNESIQRLEKNQLENQPIFLYYRPTNNILWTSDDESIVESYSRKVEKIKQMPELPRGCEVTSLAMVLNSYDIKVDKMILAEEIVKDGTPRTKFGNKIYYGNPNDGFVGEMKSYKKAGLGVYHKPIFELCKSYVGDRAVDLTGSEFEDLYPFINRGNPVWVIVNTTMKALPSSEFERWYTPSGIIDITYREHSVVVTGYDEEFVYIEDPLNDIVKVKKTEFVQAWKQMGNQAVSID